MFGKSIPVLTSIQRTTYTRNATCLFTGYDGKLINNGKFSLCLLLLFKSKPCWTYYKVKPLVWLNIKKAGRLKAIVFAKKSTVKVSLWPSIKLPWLWLHRSGKTYTNIDMSGPSLDGVQLNVTSLTEKGYLLSRLGRHLVLCGSIIREASSGATWKMFI